MVHGLEQLSKIVPLTLVRLPKLIYQLDCMKTVSLPGRFLPAAAILTACQLSMHLTAATVNVSMGDDFFSPQNTTVNAGDTVKWTNGGGDRHDTVSNSGVWRSSLLNPGGTFSFKFNNPGNFPYHCTPHEARGMVGRITVTGGVNTPPTVSIAQPANGATFVKPASFVFEATAADSDGTVSQVEFFSNGVAVRTDTSSPFRFTLNLTNAGTYILTAKATDNAGGATTSAPITVNVTEPNVPPQVAITAPANNAAFSAPAAFLIEANATDPDGTVVRVDFLSGGQLIGSDDTAPFSFSVSNLAAGSYTLIAQAVDNAGATNSSPAISVNVTAPVSLSLLSTTAAGEFQFTLEGTASGTTNIIQGSGNLTDWVNLRTNISSGTPLNFIDPASTSLPFRFYRVLQL